MPTRYRSFTDEFRTFMTSRGAWPPEKPVYEWLRANKVSVKSVYNLAKQGRAVDEKFVAGFARLLIAQHDARGKHYGQFMRAKLALADYLRERHILLGSRHVEFDNRFALSADPTEERTVVAYIGGPLLDDPGTAPGSDYLRFSLRVVGECIGSFGVVDRYVQGCRDSGELDEAAKLVLTCSGQSFAPFLSEDKAMQRAADRLQLELATYQQAVRAWHDHHPWTVVFSRDGDKRTGVSIVLPLGDEAYDDIVTGRRATFELTGKDLRRPTSTLLLEACAEQGSPDGKPNDNPTKSLLTCIGLQCAALARASYLPRGTKMRVLSFAGTPRNRQRLLESGFQPLQQQMAKLHIELMQKTFVLGREGDAYGDSMFLLAFSHLGDSAPAA
ncbi:MAG: hypothetical protein QM783_15850 [Phycisphaerales bacterium]